MLDVTRRRFALSKKAPVLEHGRRWVGPQPMTDYAQGLQKPNGERTDLENDDVIVAGDDGGILDGGDEDDRPDDCQCWDPDGELPCWPCYREGFRTQNPNADTE